MTREPILDRSLLVLILGVGAIFGFIYIEHNRAATDRTYIRRLRGRRRLLICIRRGSTHYRRWGSRRRDILLTAWYMKIRLDKLRLIVEMLSLNMTKVYNGICDGIRLGRFYPWDISSLVKLAASSPRSCKYMQSALGQLTLFKK